MRIIPRSILFVPLFILACEDGPEQIFTPNEGDPSGQNGYEPKAPWVQDGDKGFDDGEAGGDAAGRARFCDENERTELIEWMVTQPIIPDVSVGGIPLWTEDGTPIHADDLIGRPEDGKFCEPDEIYADAFVWGPLLEVIVTFDPDTRLVDRVIAYTQYLGTLEGSYTDDNGQQVPVIIGLRDRASIGGTLLDEYSSSQDEATRPNSWANHERVNQIYRMIRETFFDSGPIPSSYDCVTENICDISYTGNDQSVPQDIWLVITDANVQIRFAPDGYIQVVNAGQVRFAPFELEGNIAFGPRGGNELDFSYESTSAPDCDFTLDEGLSFGEFTDLCVDNERTIARVNYVVHTVRDAVDMAFNGMDLSFMRKTSEQPILKDGERPGPEDKLYSMFFTRSLNAVVDEFRPATIGTFYKSKLEARLQDSIIASGTTTPTSAHPLASYSLAVPFPFDDALRIGELKTFSGDSWLPLVVQDIQDLYASMTEEEKAMCDPRVTDPIYLLEPFVDAVLQSFSHGLSEGSDIYKVFWSTDDRQWVIGETHVLQNGVPWRLQVQYSLNFNGVSAVLASRGYSEIDDVYNTVNDSLHNGTQPFYTVYDSMRGGSPYALGQTGIKVNGFDRRLGMLDVELTKMNGSATSTVGMTVGGAPKDDNNGFYRQIRGERYEYVPADIVYLYGKETVFDFYVGEDGAIVAITQGRFKGSVPLCDDLWIEFGDNVPALLEEWRQQHGTSAQRECEIVHNYSENGNVLLEIVSLRNKIAITLDNGSATTVSVWR